MSWAHGMWPEGSSQSLTLLGLNKVLASAQPKQVAQKLLPTPFLYSCPSARPGPFLLLSGLALQLFFLSWFSQEGLPGESSLGGIPLVPTTGRELRE